MPLHTKLLHIEAFAEMLLHSKACFCTGMALHRDAYTQRSFCADQLVHREALIQREAFAHSFTQKLLH